MQRQFSRLADAIFAPRPDAPKPEMSVREALVQAFAPQDAASARLRAGVLAAVGCFMSGSIPLFVVMQVREHLPPPGGALMSWPGLEPASFLFAAAGVLLALPLGLWAAWRGEIWPLMRWAWLVLAIGSLLSALLALNSGVAVYPDRAEIKSGVPTQTRTLRFADAVGVSAECQYITRRRREDVAGIGYAIHFPSGEVLDLAEAPVRETRGGMRRWFAAVDRLDRGALGALPHHRSSEPRTMCVRVLRSQFDGPRFDAAARIIGLSQSEREFVFAEPHEAWRKSAVAR